VRKSRLQLRKGGIVADSLADQELMLHEAHDHRRRGDLWKALQIVFNAPRRGAVLTPALPGQPDLDGDEPFERGQEIGILGRREKLVDRRVLAVQPRLLETPAAAFVDGTESVGIAWHGQRNSESRSCVMDALS